MHEQTLGSWGSCCSLMACLDANPAEKVLGAHVQLFQLCQRMVPQQVELALIQDESLSAAPQSHSQLSTLLSTTMSRLLLAEPLAFACH